MMMTDTNGAVLSGMRFYTTGRPPAGWQNPVPAPLFSRRFFLDELCGAQLTVGATGFYELYLNGKRITKGYLAPYTANPDQTVFFDSYELTDGLRRGENTLSVLLGNGAGNPFSGEVWGHDRQKTPPSFALTFTCGDVCFTAEDMLWSDSPILFDDLRAGVHCDRTAEDPAPPRRAVLAEQPKGERRFTRCEPIREIRRLRAKSVRKGALRDSRMRDVFRGKLYDGDTVLGKQDVSGGYICDFGENTAGVPCLRIRGQRGQRIEMQFCELLFEGFADPVNVDIYPDGCAQRDVYICGGEEEEIFIPPFTYHGFRYCYVTGITPEQAADPELLTCVVLHNDVPVLSSFRCPDGISEQIFAACRRSDTSNLMNIITDCPAREKNGWTGDAAVSAEQYLMHFGAENCFADYLACVRNAQDGEGRLPLLVPSSRAGEDCPIWDSVLAFCTYYIYQYSGREDIVRENKDSILKNLRWHLAHTDERGLCERGLGDWLPPGLEAGEYHSPLGFACSTVLMEMCKKTARLMRVLGDAEAERFCLDGYRKLRSAVRREYADGCRITAGKTEKYRKPLYRPCQSSQALALWTGVFTEEEERDAAAELVRLIEENGGFFDCGFLGLRVLFPVISRFGYGSLAYRMITRPEYPSYANMICRGETTVWERFSPPGERIGSHNHHFMGDVSAWYLRDLLGIHVNPNLSDPDHILLTPDFIAPLSSCEGSLRTPGGSVSVAWERRDGRVHLRVRKEGKVRVDFGDSCRTAEMD